MTLEKEGGICYTYSVVVCPLSLRERSRIMGKNLKGREDRALSRMREALRYLTTVDKYVHVTDDSLTAGVQQFEASRM